MRKADWIWFDGKLVDWDDARVHVLSHTLHYGGGAFEGIRFYQTAKGPAVFRLKEHVERLIYSCDAIEMTLNYSSAEIESAILETIKANELQEGYIRPLAFWGAGDLRIISHDLPVHLSVACWPLGQYLAAECVDVKVSDYIRIHPKSTVADAKLCGHYLNSIIASMCTKNSKYHECLLLDHQGNIAEGAGENFFCVIDDVLCTPNLGNVLAGITRETVMNIARDEGIECEERTLSLDDAYMAKEAFFSGTAVEVTPIRSLNDNFFSDGQMGKITALLRQRYFDAVHGKSSKYEHFLTYVN